MSPKTCAFRALRVSGRFMVILPTPSYIAVTIVSYSAKISTYLANAYGRTTSPSSVYS